MVKSLRLIKVLGATFLSVGAISICAAAVNHSLSSKTEETNASSTVSSYYSSVSGSSANSSSGYNSLLESIYTKINKNLSRVAYDSLKTNGYPACYTRSDGYLYDIYCNNSYYTPGSAYTGSSKTAGGGYNREHTIPKSYWGGSESNMGCDLFIVLPSDTYINGVRSNYPYGITSSGTTYKKSGDNISHRLGTTTNTNYVASGTVFEPDDSRKGDLARIYFYSVAMYLKHTSSASDDLGPVSNWNGGGTVASGKTIFGSGTGYKNYIYSNYLNMLLKWHTDDPVDADEISRNGLIEDTQGNRNPFVDHPSWVDIIWGGTYGASKTNGENTSNGTASVVNGAISGTTPSTNPSLSISPSSLTLTEGGSEGTITATIANGSGDVSWTGYDTSVVSITTSGTNKTTCTVTPVGEGTTTITVSFSTATSQTCSITVNASGGSGGGGGGSSSDFSLYSGEITEGDYLITYDGGAMNTTVTSDRLQYDSVTPVNDVVSNPDSSIIWHIAPSGDYWTLYNESADAYAASTGVKNKAQTLSSGTDDKSLWTISGTETYEFVNKYNGSNSVNANLRKNGTYGFACYATSTGGALTLYKAGESGSSSEDLALSSISVKTSPTTTYTSGNKFSPTGLVITTLYSDNSGGDISYAGHTSEFTFKPDLNTTLKTNNTKVTITYGGKSVDLPITVNPSSISASVDRIFYVGETISASDITVTDNDGFEVNGFTFANDGYRFEYNNSNGGGSTETKTFTDAISYAGKTASLEVSVKRKAYVTPTVVQGVTDTITATDLPATGTTYTDFIDVSKSSDAKYAGNSAKDGSGNIQMRSKNSNSGLVSTTSGGKIESVTITVGSGTNTINVYGSNTAYSDATDLYDNGSQGTLVGSLTATGTITFTDDYDFVGIRSSNGAIYISSIEIKYKGSTGAETATNVANFIMYGQTTGQCETQLGQAITKLNTMSTTDKNNFWNNTQNDYVLSKAKERLQAWATSQHKTLTYSNGTYAVSGSNFNMMSVHTESGSTTLILVMVGITSSMIGFAFVGYWLKKKKER